MFTSKNTEHAVQSIGFNWYVTQTILLSHSTRASLSPQKKRNRTRAEYEKCYAAYVKVKENRECSEDEAWSIILICLRWYLECKDLDQRLREYLNLAATVGRPKSNVKDVAKYNHLVERRQGCGTGSRPWILSIREGDYTTSWWRYVPSPSLLNTRPSSLRLAGLVFPTSGPSNRSSGSKSCGCSSIWIIRRTTVPRTDCSIQ